MPDQSAKITESAVEDLASKSFYTLELIVNNQQIRTLDKLRDTLLSKLMSGEVRVRI
jgi:hypothetical protein